MEVYCHGLSHQTPFLGKALHLLKDYPSKKENYLSRQHLKPHRKWEFVLLKGTKVVRQKIYKKMLRLKKKSNLKRIWWINLFAWMCWTKDLIIHDWQVYNLSEPYGKYVHNTYIYVNQVQYQIWSIYIHKYDILLICDSPCTMLSIIASKLIVRDGTFWCLRGYCNHHLLQRPLHYG